MKKDSKVIGVLGGMGPEATASFFLKVIRETRVIKDQDHIRTIIDSNPEIPDRTNAILYNGPSPVPEMIKTVENLQRAGATVAVMPCITAHYFYDAIQKEITIPLHHVLQGLNTYINKMYPRVEKIGILSTDATKETGLIQQHLKGKTILHPNDFEQKNKVMRAIYGDNGIKQGNTGPEPKQLLLEVAERLINEEHCEMIIGGCTEVELVLKDGDLSVPFIDPMRIAAKDLTKSDKTNAS